MRNLLSTISGGGPRSREEVPELKPRSRGLPVTKPECSSVLPEKHELEALR